MAKRGKIWHGRNAQLALENGANEIFWMFFAPLNGLTLGLLGILVDRIIPRQRRSAENVAMMPKGRVRGHKGAIETDEDIAKALVKSWMSSEGHRMNIVNAEFRKIGVGVWRRRNRFFATQLFTN